MKNAFGATLLFQIVIFFVVLFAGYISLSINQAKAFNIKNEIIRIIEKNAPNLDGVGSNFAANIKESLERVGYRLEGTCSAGFEGYNRMGVKSGSKGAFCIKKVESTLAGRPGGAVYYKVETFYQLDIPILKSIFNLKARGETKVIYNKECSICAS